MVLALRGLFDIAEVATDAIDTLVADRVAPMIASIDPDPFFDFTQERPQVEFDDDDETRQIRWPQNEFRLVRFPDLTHDLIVLSGVEPHLRYATFAGCIVHRRPPVGLRGRGHRRRRARSRYPTPVRRRWSAAAPPRVWCAPSACRYPATRASPGWWVSSRTTLEGADLPAVSLRVGVPHYLGNAKHPQSSAALLRHLEHVLGVPTGHAALDEDAMRWRSLHDEAVAEDDQAGNYVAMLEREFDRRIEATLPSGDDLAAELEKFLREQRDDET